MERPPRRLKEPILDKVTIFRSLAQGIIISLVTFLSYVYLLHTGASQALAATFAFTTLVFANVLVVYVLQSGDLALKNFLVDFKDKIIVLINTIVILILLLFIYIPFLGRLIGSTPLSWWQVLLCLGLALLSTWTFDLFKLHLKKKQ